MALPELHPLRARKWRHGVAIEPMAPSQLRMTLLREPEPRTAPSAAGGPNAPPWESMAVATGSFHAQCPAGWIWMTRGTKAMREVFSVTKSLRGGATYCGYTRCWLIPTPIPRKVAMALCQATGSRPMPKPWLQSLAGLGTGTAGQVTFDRDHYRIRCAKGDALMRTFAADVDWQADERVHFEFYSSRYEVWVRHNTLHRQLRAMFQVAQYQVTSQICRATNNLMAPRAGLLVEAGQPGHRLTGAF